MAASIKDKIKIKIELIQIVSHAMVTEAEYRCVRPIERGGIVIIFKVLLKKTNSSSN